MCLDHKEACKYQEKIETILTRPLREKGYVPNAVSITINISKISAERLRKASEAQGFNYDEDWIIHVIKKAVEEHEKV